MDEIVLRSMLKWPDVPAVYGWLSLDRRGNWMIKTVAGRFERIAHAAVREFIGRNYASDAEGRWFFQNGPQRVFVALDYTPWVYRLDDAGEGLLAHTGTAPRSLEAAFVDDAGALLLKAEIGVGVLLDRDLSTFVERLNAAGRWFFQNGPQRVFVALDYTPWVYRLDDAGEGLLAHTGTAPRSLEAAFVDDAGALLLKAEIGVGVLLDRDLSTFVERLND